MTLYTLASLHMMLVGVLSITLVASHPRYLKWGFALGLWNQWAWYYVAWHDASWAIMVMNLVYTLNYLRGVRRYWSYTWT